MGKQIGPYSGRFVGRVGAVVGAKLKGGEYVSRSYQPQVKNPRTKRQQASRLRFTLASGVASVLAEALNIGYAKAAGGTRMYPRNMAVRDLVKDTTCIVMNDGDFEVIEISELKVSKKAGIEVKPIFAYTAPGGGTPGSLSLQNVGEYDYLLANNRVGVVVVAVRDNGDGTLEMAKMLKGNASTPFTLTEAEVQSLSGCALLGFVKAIPNSGNSVATDAWPWKYPSVTSETAFIRTLE